MDRMRDKHIAEMDRLQAAIKKTKSPYLKSDYTKAYNRMRSELAEYDKYKAGV